MQAADIEKFVLWSLDDARWFPHLWFPVVQRGNLNFPDGPTDAEIHDALLRLIRNGFVTVRKAPGSTSSKTRDLTLEMLQHLEADGRPTYRLHLKKSIHQKLHAALERSMVAARGHFELFAHGSDFDVDAYLKTSSLDFDNVWRRGRRPTSGVGKRLGDGAVILPHEQQRVAIQYLSKHRDALRELRNFPGVETFILGLQYTKELEENLLGFCMGPAPGLMRLALDIGIDPMFYVVLKEPGQLDRVFSKDAFLQSW